MERIKQCLILAAGNGTRLRAISADLPKPLVEFQGRPILEHIVRRAQEARIEEFVIVLGYRGDLIRDWFESRWQRPRPLHLGGESGLSQEQRGLRTESQKRPSR